MSNTPVSVAPADAAYFAACSAPRCPTPTTPARSGCSTRDIGNLSLGRAADHAYGVLVGEHGHAIAFEKDRRAGFDCERACAAAGHRLDGRRAYRGNVEAHVLPMLGHLDDHRRAAPERAGAPDGGVGSF